MTKSNKFNPFVYFFICLVVMISLDFLLTNYVLHNLFLSDDFKFIDIVYIQNTGAAFSTFQHFTFILILISVIAMIGILWYLFKNRDKYSVMIYFFCAMLTAGIFCNTYERITLGYVRDFISFKFMDFPIFNISDILINLSVLAIIILIVTKKYKKDVQTNIQS